MLKFTIGQCLVLCLLGINSFAGDSAVFYAHFKLLPEPQKIEFREGKGVVYTGLRAISLTNLEKRPVMTGILAGLPLVIGNDGSQRDEKSRTGGSAAGNGPAKNGLAGAGAPGNVSLEIRQDLGLPSPEGYILEIGDQRVRVLASQEAGLFYGLQTLAQLLEDAHDGQVPIPACRITDYPRIPYRAIHLDMKHHVETGHYYYHIIDQLASIKINAVIVEFEDKLRYRKAPLVGSPDAVSIEEFAALSRYAKERNIEISPLVQGLGHASFILKHDVYKGLRDDPASDWVFDPLNPRTYDLQFSLYEDAMAATPYGKYLHVGGDEVGALGKSELSKKSGMQPIELQLYWLRKVTDFAKAHNRIPIFWDDMVFKLSGLYETTYDSAVGPEKTRALWKSNAHLLEEKIPLFPTNCVYMRWNYDDPQLPGNQMALDWYKAHGLNAMGATAAQCMTPMLPLDQSKFEAIRRYCQLTADKGLSGLLCTVWDDCSPHFETIWRGLYDFALFSWHYRDIDVRTAHALFRHRFYGPEMAPDTCEFQDLLEKALPFWETALLTEGDRENYHKNFTLIGLPDKNKPGAWSLQYKDRLGQAVKAVALYDLIHARLRTAAGLACRNGYALAVMDQINELQVYPAKLLLLLKQYDETPPENKQALATRVREQTAGFQQIRTNMEKVYSETRILGNPEGYQLDANFHEHLANGTNNTDWMYVYELAMNEQINEWTGEKKVSHFSGFGGGGATFHPTVSPFNPAMAFVSCDMTGSFVTHDGGGSWNMFNLHGVVGYYVFDPLDSNTVYAYSLALFRSGDRGRTWKMVYPDPSEVNGVVSKGDHAEEVLVTRDHTTRKVLAMAIDPASSQKLYAVISIDGSTALYFSADKGRHWTRDAVSAEQVRETQDLFIDPSSPAEDRTLYITGPTGIACREGGRWIHRGGPEGVSRLTRFAGAFDPALHKFILYAMAGHSYWDPQGNISGIYLSEDGGVRWQNRQSGLLGLSADSSQLPEWRAIATSPKNPAIVYVSYHDLRVSADARAMGVAKSNDYGKTWQLCWKDVVSKEEKVPSSNYTGGWIDQRFGTTWGENPFGLGVSPTDPDICYATDFGRVIKTTNGGATWEQTYTRKVPGAGWVSRGIEVTTGYNMVWDPYDAKHVFMANTDIGLMESRDGGASWASATDHNGVPEAWENTTYWITFDPAVKGRAWAAMSGTHDLPRPKMWRKKGITNYEGGVLVTEDGGKSWQPVSSDIGEAAVTYILIDSSSSPAARTLYACAFGKGVYKSVDGGKSWRQKNKGIEGVEPFAWRISRNERDGSLLLVVSRRIESGGVGIDQDGALYRSTDGADSWTRISLPPGTNGPTCVLTDPDQAGRLLLSAWGSPIGDRFTPDAGGGIWLSPDNGKTWKQTLSADQHIHDLSFDPRLKRFYACGFGGRAWLSNDRGGTWRPIKGYNFKWGKRVEPDPMDPRLVYIITYGGGVSHLPAEAADGHSGEEDGGLKNMQY